MEIRLNMQINKLSKDMQMSINFGTVAGSYYRSEQRAAAILPYRKV